MSNFQRITVGWHKAVAGRELQDANGAHLTMSTIMVRTTGPGHVVTNVAFDATYLSEPVFSYGGSLISMNVTEWLPLPTALVSRWTRDDQGHFNGAQVVLHVDMRSARGYDPGGHAVPPSVSGLVLRPRIGHQLTFTGPAVPRLDTHTGGTQPGALPTGLGGAS